MSSLSSFLDPKRADVALTDVPLLRPVAFTQPLRIEYGLGKARQLETFLGGWSDRRVLVIADAYNAGRVDILDRKSVV